VQHRGYTYLTAREVRFVEAAIARPIPADELGPGALEAGVAYFCRRAAQPLHQAARVPRL